MKNRSGFAAIMFSAVICAGIAGSALTHGGAESGSRRASLSIADFQEPPVEYRPFVRWWWPGNDVDKAELEREVDLLANARGGAAAR